VEDALPANDILAGQALSEGALAAEICRQCAAEELANFLAERNFFTGKAQIHGLS
jgi:hypothetical protein